MKKYLVNVNGTEYAITVEEVAENAEKKYVYEGRGARLRS